MEKLVQNYTCPLEAYLGSLKGESTKNIELAQAINDLIQTSSDAELSRFEWVRDRLNEKVSASYFKLMHERKVNIANVAEGLSDTWRYLLKNETIDEKMVTVSFITPNTRRIASKRITLLSHKAKDYYFTIIKKGKNSYAISEGANNSIYDFENYIYWKGAKNYLDGKGIDYKNVYIRVIGLTPKGKTWSNKQDIRTANFDEAIDRTAWEEDIVSSDESYDNITVFNNRECPDCDFCAQRVLCDFLQENKFKHNFKLEKVQTEEKVESEKRKTLQLTDNQEELVNFSRGICRVLASAGSGKTTVLAGVRTCNLIQNFGYDESDFLFLTFSERGVQEIKEKLEQWGEYYKLNIAVDKFRIYTFNSFGQMLLDQNYEDLGYPQKPRLILKAEKLDLIARILDDMPMIEHLNYAKPDMDMYRAFGAIVQVGKYISWLLKNKHSNKNYLDVMEEFREKNSFFKLTEIKKPKLGKKATPEEIAKANAEYEAQIKAIRTEIHENIYKVFEEYEQRKKEKGLIEYDDQISAALDVLKSPRKASMYGATHLVVDEFQDSDEAQLKIIKKLIDAPQFESFVACGDDSQSIFAWRGATSENIVKFEEYFGDCDKITDIPLVDNFRCNKAITEFTNKLNDLNIVKVNKTVNSVRDGSSNSIEFTELLSPEKDTTLYNAVDKVRALEHNGEKLQDIAIISRTNLELTKLAKILEQAKIPYNMVVSQALIDVPSVRGLLSFGKWIFNQDNFLYFSEFYQVATDTTVLDSPLENVLMEEEQMMEELSKLDSQQLVQYYLDIVHEKAITDKAVEAFAKLLDKETFSSDVELANYLSSFIDYKEDTVVEKDLTLYKAVTIMTAHSSKGSEFKNVIVLLDNFDGNKSKVELDEERHTYFVAATRAKEKLCVIGNKGKPGESPNKCNRFLAETNYCLGIPDERIGFYHIGEKPTENK